MNAVPCCRRERSVDHVVCPSRVIGVVERLASITVQTQSLRSGRTWNGKKINGVRCEQMSSFVAMLMERSILETGWGVQALALAGKRLKDQIFPSLFFVDFVRLLLYHLVDFVRHYHPR
jgi:hypothetical protein